MKNDFSQKMWELVKSAEINRSTLAEILSRQTGITQLETRVLIQINFEEKIPLGELAEKLYMDLGNLSRICKKLEKKGFLLRERSLEDNRLLEISLSENGKRIGSEYHERFIESACAFMEKYSAADLEKMIAIMTDFNAIMKKNVLKYVDQ